MARFGRRRPADPAADDEQWPDDGARAEAPAPPTAAVDDAFPPSRLRGTELTYAYGVGIVLAIAGIVMLVVTKGKGAPVHAQPTWAALAVVFGAATALSVRFSNRMLTALIAIAGGFVSGQAKTPNSLSGIKIVALIAPVAFGLVVFRRQSKADRLARARSPRQSAADRRAGRAGRGGKDAATRPVPGKPGPSGRYTPPKALRPPSPSSRSPRGRAPKS